MLSARLATHNITVVGGMRASGPRGPAAIWRRSEASAGLHCAPRRSFQQIAWRCRGWGQNVRRNWCGDMARLMGCLTRFPSNSGGDAPPLSTFATMDMTEGRQSFTAEKNACQAAVHIPIREHYPFISGPRQQCAKSGHPPMSWQQVEHVKPMFRIATVCPNLRGRRIGYLRDVRFGRGL